MHVTVECELSTIYCSKRPQFVCVFLYCISSVYFPIEPVQQEASSHVWPWAWLWVSLWGVRMDCWAIGKAPLSRHCQAAPRTVLSVFVLSVSESTRVTGSSPVNLYPNWSGVKCHLLVSNSWLPSWVLICWRLFWFPTIWIAHPCHGVLLGFLADSSGFLVIWGWWFFLTWVTNLWLWLVFFCGFFGRW